MTLREFVSFRFPRRAAALALGALLAACGGGGGGGGSPSVPGGPSGPAGLNIATAQAAVAALDGVVYVAGGNGGSGAIASVQGFDPPANTWAGRAGLPGASYQGDGAVAINGKLYVAGGWSGSLPIASLYIFDAAANTWSSGASLPNLSGCGASGAIDGTLYVVTPCNGLSGYTALLHAYDPATDAWSALASSGSVHANPAYGVINGKLYVAGGLNGPAGTTGPWSLNGTTEAYDPVAGTWAPLAAMPVPVQDPASAVYNGKLYVLGGVSAGSVAVSNIQVYNPHTNTWANVDKLPAPLAGARGAALNGVIYAAGGGASGAASRGFLAHLPPANPGANSWASKTAMPTSRFGTTATEIDGLVYVAGGYVASGATSVPTGVLEVYDPLNDGWTTKTSMPSARGNLGAAAVDGKLYVLGGDNFSCATYTTNEMYDPRTDAWSTRAAMPTARSLFAVAEVDGVLYAIGGNANCNNSTDFAVVEAYHPATDSWTTETPLPRTARALGAGVVNGILYVVTGSGAAGSVNGVYAFDPRANAGAGIWVQRAAIPNAGTITAGTPAVFTVNGVIYVAGGDGAGLVQAYDPVADAWSTRASLPTNVVWAPGGASANGIGYAIGGWTSALGAPSAAVQAYTP